MPDNKLLPCPECSGELIFRQSTFEQYQQSIYECKNCKCYMNRREYSFYVKGYNRPSPKDERMDNAR